MLFEDKEVNLIEDFRLFSRAIHNSIGVIPESDDLFSIIQSLVDDNSWEKDWIDNSAKNAPPPDFYNDKAKLMLEVMRIDDHAFERKGRIQNPTNQKMRKIEKELRSKGVFDSFPQAQLIINAPTDLPTEEDHNYRFYKENFKRIIDKHKANIDLYRKNHPGYKLIFFIFDESSMYCKVEEPNKTIKQGEMFAFEAHYWFADKAFVDVFKDSGIDYLIWFVPYKWEKQEEAGLNMPMTFVCDCNNIPDKTIEYDPEFMMSADE